MGLPNILKPWLRETPILHLLDIVNTVVFIKSIQFVRNESFSMDYVYLSIILYCCFAANMMVADVFDKDFDARMPGRENRPLPSGKCTVHDNLGLAYVLMIIVFALIPYVKFLQVWQYLLMFGTHMFYNYSKFIFPDPQFAFYVMFFTKCYAVSDYSLYSFCFAVFINIPMYLIEVYCSSDQVEYRTKYAYCALGTFGDNIKAVIAGSYIIGLVCGLYCLYVNFTYMFLLQVFLHVIFGIRHSLDYFNAYEEYKKKNLIGVPFNNAFEQFVVYGIRCLFL